MSESRKPKLEKVGCYFSEGNERTGFDFFTKTKVSNGDLFVYNKGILWKLKEQIGENKE